MSTTKLRAIYNGVFDGVETFCANAISNVTERIRLRRYLKHRPSRDLRIKVSAYWKKYKRISPRWACYYASSNGIEDPRYIPNDLYYSKIDQYFNDRKLGWGFNDKNYYTRIFPNVKQPEVVVRKVNGILLDKKYQILSIEEAYDLIKSCQELICKPALETGSGRGIRFWNTSKDTEEIYSFLSSVSEKDYIIQKLIVQHSELNRIHSTSINTLRIVSILMPEGPYIISSNLRMGTGGGRVDNVSAGGISCGISEEGILKKYATSCYTGELFEKHPSSNFVFDGFQIPGYQNAIKMVLSVAPSIPHFRLVSWDIAIDADEMPILIEANMRKGMINLNQFNNGPLFGELTTRVLDEVFRVK